MESFLAAISCLTVLPVRQRDLGPEVIAGSRYWYPITGLLLGLLLAGCAVILARLEAPMPAAVLLLALWTCVSGGLHLDGWCDLCDGLFGGHSPEERLQILKDPHLGSFALLGGVLLLLGKFAALADLLARNPSWLVVVILGGVAWARCLVLVMAAGAVYPRPEGTAKLLVEATRWPEAILLSAGAVIAVLLANPRGIWTVATLFVVSCLALLGLRWLCQRRLGGITGDCLGAGIELVELVFLLGGAIAAR